MPFNHDVDQTLSKYHVEIAEIEDRAKAREIGRIGKTFGSREYIATLVCAVLSISCFVLMVIVVFFYDGRDDLSRRDVIDIFGGFFTLTLGFLTGSIVGKHRQAG